MWLWLWVWSTLRGGGFEGADKCWSAPVQSPTIIFSWSFAATGGEMVVVVTLDGVCKGTAWLELRMCTGGSVNPAVWGIPCNKSLLFTLFDLLAIWAGRFVCNVPANVGLISFNLGICLLFVNAGPREVLAAGDFVKRGFWSCLVPWNISGSGDAVDGTPCRNVCIGFVCPNTVGGCGGRVNVCWKRGSFMLIPVDCPFANAVSAFIGDASVFSGKCKDMPTKTILKIQV